MLQLVVPLFICASVFRRFSSISSCSNGTLCRSCPIRLHLSQCRRLAAEVIISSTLVKIPLQGVVCRKCPVYSTPTFPGPAGGKKKWWMMWSFTITLIIHRSSCLVTGACSSLWPHHPNHFHGPSSLLRRLRLTLGCFQPHSSPAPHPLFFFFFNLQQLRGVVVCCMLALSSSSPPSAGGPEELVLGVFGQAYAPPPPPSSLSVQLTLIAWSYCLNNLDATVWVRCLWFFKMSFLLLGQKACFPCLFVF